MNHRLNVLIASIFFVPLSLFSQNSSLIISEVQPSNQSTIADEDGKFEDWIELHNTTNQPLDLTGWTITDDATNPKQWTMTGGTLAANGYLIVFASDKDRKVPGSPLHTNFKLNATGDYLALYNPSGIKVMELNQLPRVESDFSYSLYQGSWYYTTEPTPGAANTLGGIFQNPAPLFSVQHGLFNAPFNLEMTCGLSDSRIYYTLDGSVPSATHGTLYQQALSVVKTSIVRAIAVSNPLSDNQLSESAVTTQSYLFPDDIIHQSNTPTGYPAKWGKYASMSDSAIADYEMDPELISDPAFAEKVKASFYDLPIVSLVTDLNHFFNKQYDSITGGIYIYTAPFQTPDQNLGKGWERPLSLELIEPSKGVSLQVDCGVQLHGGHSRHAEKSPKHSLRIDFRSDYGIGKLRYPLIGDEGPKTINSFFLRAGFSDSWYHWGTQYNATYARDQWAKTTQLRMNGNSSHIAYAHLFINGLYWGLYDPIERLNDDTFTYWYGGNEADWDVIKDDGQYEAADGNLIAWKQLKKTVDSISSTNVEIATTMYQKIQGKNLDGSENVHYPKLMDVDNFIDYMLINFYGYNTDWDYHNWIAARNRINPGEGFKFFCWDSENILLTGDVDRNLLNENEGELSKMFQKLRNVPLFNVRVGDRAQIHLFNDGWLSASKTAQTFSDLTDPIEQSLFAESARWGDYRRDVHNRGGNPKLYREDVHFMAEKNILLNTYFPQRTPKFIQQLKDERLFPSLNAPYFTINSQPFVSDTIVDGNYVSIKNAQAGNKIYYTFDNTDPAVWSMDGTANPSATSIYYQNSIRPGRSVYIKARAWYNNVWSPLVEHGFTYIPTVALDQEMESIQIAANYPNPFRSSTTFSYSLPSAAKVIMTIYDISGRPIRTILSENQGAGMHQFEYDGSALTAGVYVCKIDILGAQNQSKSIRIIKL